MIHSWLTHYIDTYGDKMPHTTDVYLPMQCEKIALYEVMIEELGALYGPESLPEPNTFYQVWQHSFPHLKIPLCVILGKCDVCCDLVAKIASAKGKERKKLQQQKRDHVKLQNMVCLRVFHIFTFLGEKGNKSTTHVLYH